jgi:hypothetical protein
MRDACDLNQKVRLVWAGIFEYTTRTLSFRERSYQCLRWFVQHVVHAHRLRLCVENRLGNSPYYFRELPVVSCTRTRKGEPRHS